MTSQPSPSLYSGSPSGSAPTTGSPQSMALDNIIRRELKVSDPNDPIQIAEALLTLYKDSPRAQAISQEAKGLPFLQSAALAPMLPQGATSSDAELQQGRDDVERDLHELTTNSLLKDVTPELQGWAQAVRSAITEGATAARFALDSRQRDKAFGIRRQLGDYARMARLVGALTTTLNLPYRKFAQSLDEVAAVILVRMGEALANVGFSGGRFLLQAPYSELQVRRDTVIYALRNLIGSTQTAYGQEDWPRGLDAYRKLLKRLEEQGQGDLRALLLENELSRGMDELIQRSAHGTADGLRALGSTAQLDLQRFRRLIAFAGRKVTPESPPLAAFLEALQLFADGFDTAGGFRLLRIARPPILFYGLYGIGGLAAADKRLLRLIIERGLLAEQLDCFLNCDCGEDAVLCQIVLDKILYDVDRAIDLYAVGTIDLGPPECRAAAYWHVIEERGTCVEIIVPCVDAGTPCSSIPCGTTGLIDGILKRIQGLLQPVAPAVQDDWEVKLPVTGTAFDNICPPQDRIEELCLQKDMEAHWENLVRTMAPTCVGINRVFGIDRANKETGFIPQDHPPNEGVIRCLINEAILNVRTPTDEEPKCVPFEPNVPDTTARSQQVIAEGAEFVKDNIKECIRRTLSWTLNQDELPPPEQIPTKPGRSPGRRR